MAVKRLTIAVNFLRPRTTVSLRCLSTLRLTSVSPTSKANISKANSRVPTATMHHQQSLRWHSVPPSTSKVYDFEAMKSFTSTPNPSRILIDVREPSEYADGYIPGSINLPIKSAPEALLLPADEFEDRFGFEKPRAEQEVVFYCRSGVRSSAAAKLAEQAGYERIAEYRGSWMDWSERGGEVAH